MTDRSRHLRRSGRRRSRWFSALCSTITSSWACPTALAVQLGALPRHRARGRAQGFRNILCPSSYQVGQDTLSFVAGCAPITARSTCWPPCAAAKCNRSCWPAPSRRSITCSKGRLTVNIISSDFPGEKAESDFRYQRSREVVEILKQAWTQDEINYDGEVYDFKGLTTDPASPYQTGGPLLYFGGYSPAALRTVRPALRRLPDVARTEGEHRRPDEGRERGGRKYGRTLDYGLRVHMIVRDTEAEAKEYAEYSVRSWMTNTASSSATGRMIRISLGVAHQAKARELADKFGYVEPHLWTGVGRARSGCGAALVGSTDQVLSRDRGLSEDGHPRVHLLGLSAYRRMHHFGHA